MIMPYNYKSQKQEVMLDSWKLKFIKPDIFMIPNDYKTYLEMDTYKRVTGFMKEYLERMFSGDQRRIPEDTVHSYSIQQAYGNNPIPENWWDTALKVRAGKKIDNNPIVMTSDSETQKAIFMNIMPAYRALKESHNKRWLIEYIFNHKEYTAERDTLKAMEGLMMATTGKTVQEIDAELVQHQQDQVENKSVEKSRIETNKMFREYLKNPAKYRAREQKKLDKINAERRKSGYTEEKLPDYTPFDRYVSYYNLMKQNKERPFSVEQLSKNANDNANNYNFNDMDDEIYENDNDQPVYFNYGEEKKKEVINNNNNRIINEDEEDEYIEEYADVSENLNKSVKEEYQNDNDNSVMDDEPMKEQMSVDTEDSEYEDPQDKIVDGMTYQERLLAFMAKMKAQENENKQNIVVEEEKPQMNYWDDGSKPEEMDANEKQVQQIK